MLRMAYDYFAFAMLKQNTTEIDTLRCKRKLSTAKVAKQIC